MTMTKAQAAAKARETKAAKAEAEAARLQAQAEAGYNQATGEWETIVIKPTTYEYVGGMNDGVVVVIDGTSYEFMPHQPVHLAHPVANLDSNPDFVKVN